MDPGQPHTIFIGDSMTYGIGLADLETIPAQYCRLKKRDCINLGQPGSSTYDQVKTLKYFLSTYRWRPKQVYLMMNVMTSALFSGNDLTDNLNDVLQADKKPDQDNASIEHAEQSVKSPSVFTMLFLENQIWRVWAIIFLRPCCERSLRRIWNGSNFWTHWKQQNCSFSNWMPSPENTAFKPASISFTRCRTLPAEPI